MGLIERISKAVTRDFDQRVSGSDGSAESRHDIRRDESELTVDAVLGGGARGVIDLEVRGGDKDPSVRQSQAESELRFVLGRGDTLRGGTLSLTAMVTGPADTLATLGATIEDGDLNRSSYSVEARCDGQGRANLRLVVRFA
jgi:hypothetical protein